MGKPKILIISASVALVAIAATSAYVATAGAWTKPSRRWRWRVPFLYQLTRFRYSDTIGSNAIRLLEICENMGQAPELVVKTFPLGATPPYLAISYTWDDPGKLFEVNSLHADRKINLNGRSFLVKDNLYDVLAQLGKSRPGFYVWIDAISINQQCVEEVQAQIGIMDSVFSNACETIIWVGPATDRTERGIAIIKKISTMSEDKVRHWLETRTFGNAFNIEDPEVMAQNGMPPLSAEDWHDLASVYSRRWFTRLWVVQELALSRNPTLMIGPHMTPWADVGITALCMCFSNAILSVVAGGGVGTYGKELLTGMIGALVLQVVMEWAAGEARWSPGISLTSGMAGEMPVAILMSLLVCTVSFQSTIERDRLYGVLALFQRMAARQCPGQDDMNIAVNYQSPADEFFRSFWADVFRRSHSLLPLSFAGHRQWRAEWSQIAHPSIQGLEASFLTKLWRRISSSLLDTIESPKEWPSWLPPGLTCYSPILRPNFTGEPIFDATKTRFASFVGHSDFEADVTAGILRASSRAVGTVEEIGPKHGALIADTSLLLQWFELALRCATVGGRYRYTGQGIQETLWRTLILDQDTDGRMPGRDVAESVREWVLLLMLRVVQLVVDENGLSEEDKAMRADKVLASLSGLSEVDPLGGFPTSEEVRVLAAEFGNCPMDGVSPITAEERSAKAEAMARKLAKFDILLMQNMGLCEQRLTRTREGHLALVPADTEVKDQIVLLHRHPTPLVLRRTGVEEDRYILVGDCYVHGIMFGEAITDDMDWPPLNTTIV